MEALLKQIGASPEEYRLEDGSGLSRNTQVTPRVVTRLLAHMWASKEKDTFLSLLPVGGEDGSLAKRLCCSAEAHGIHAKTGTLARSLALSGYADSKTLGSVAFSIIVNNFGVPANVIENTEDAIIVRLTQWSRR